MAELTTLTTDDAWNVLLAVVRDEHTITKRTPLYDTSDRRVCFADPGAERSWTSVPETDLDSDARTMFDLYMPLCVGVGTQNLIVAHLGQSLDGRIATHSGVSQFITGSENLVHTHRMRALFDAVLVGAHTASNDNPKLTTRLASGDHPTRVLIDPHCTVDLNASIFTDGQADTIIICDSASLPATSDMTYIGITAKRGILQTSDIIAALGDRGIHRIFIEGGGITVSHFLKDKRLGRLHVCVAPMIIGSGRPSFQLPEVSELKDGVFLKAKHFPSGPDILFDCQLCANE